MALGGSMVMVAWVSVEAQPRPQQTPQQSAPGSASDAGAPTPRLAFAVQAAGTVRERRDLVRLEQALRRHAPAVLLCYARARSAHPTLAGQVEASFVVGATGEAEELTVEGMPGVPSVAQCVSERLREAHLPTMSGGRRRLRVVFRFSVATGGPTEPVVLDPHVLWRREPRSPELLLRQTTLYGAALKEE